MNAKIGITVKVFPTEVGDRVKDAVLNIFPDAELKLGESHLTACATSLKKFETRLRDQRIRDSARSVLRRCASEEEIAFCLNKQAAYVGKVNFTEGDSVLGDIEVRITTGEPDALIDSLTLVERKEDWE